MNAVEQSVEIKHRAKALGFTATGIARLERNPHAAELERWLAQGHAGSMTYLNRQAEKRKDPRAIMPGARAAVVTLTNYFHGRPSRASRPGAVAQYAWSSDYHDVLGERLEQLAATIRELVPGATTRAYVDAGPVPERELAQLAGLGWIGKNMMLINPDIGSFTFIGVVLTDAALDPDQPFEADRCGTCTRCLEACPTGAFVGPRNLDARACISYLTIERRGAFTAAEQAQVRHARLVRFPHRSDPDRYDARGGEHTRARGAVCGRSADTVVGCGSPVVRAEPLDLRQLLGALQRQLGRLRPAVPPARDSDRE
jgi:epoxyqueuosine reductase